MASSGQDLVLKPGQSQKGTAPSTSAKKAKVKLPAIGLSQADIQAKLAGTRAVADEKTPLLTGSLSSGNALSDDQADLQRLREVRQNLPRPNASGSIFRRENQPLSPEEIKKQQAALLNELENDFRQMFAKVTNQSRPQNLVRLARGLVTAPEDRPLRIKKPKALRKQSNDLAIGFSKPSPKAKQREVSNEQPPALTLTVTGP